MNHDAAPHPGAAADSPLSRRSAADRWLTVLLVGISLISLAGLVLAVIPALAGDRPLLDWFAWIPMLGFPLAFLLLMSFLARAYLRRRAL